RTCQVGSYKPNTFGLFDVHGNVWEWCHDWYSSDVYQETKRRDPQGPNGGESRVLRGGAWDGARHRRRPPGAGLAPPPHPRARRPRAEGPAAQHRLRRRRGRRGLTAGLVIRRNANYVDGRTNEPFEVPASCTSDEERAEERARMLWFVFGPPIHPAALWRPSL